MIDNVDIGKDELTWVCDGCGADCSVAVSTLSLGNAEHPDAIALPPCPSCGTQKFLIRTWEPHVDFPHRRVINALAEHLRSTGRAHPHHQKLHQERGAPPLLQDLSTPVHDLTRRKAARLAREQHEAALKRLAEAPPAPLEPAPQEAAPADAGAERERRLFEAAERRRLVVARASVNKRLGLPPGSEPPADDLEAELARNATEFLG